LSGRARLIATAAAALVLAIVIAVWHAQQALDESAKSPVPPPPAPPPGAEPAAPPAPPARAPGPGPAAVATNLPPDAAPPSPSAQAMVARMTEAVLMARLREVARTDSAQAIEIARAGNKQYPDSPDAPERTSILIHALVTQDKLSEGRAEAEYMVNHYPDSSWVREIEGFTGAHRHRTLRVNDAGQLEYY
jgi:hypothetical protein